MAGFLLETIYKYKLSEAEVYFLLRPDENVNNYVMHKHPVRSDRAECRNRFLK